MTTATILEFEDFLCTPIIPNCYHYSNYSYYYYYYHYYYYYYSHTLRNYDQLVCAENQP